jgi:hypothetical protein
MTTHKTIVAIAPSNDIGLLGGFYGRTGEALVMWQGLENAHYRLFLQLLGAANNDVAALTYFSHKSFNSRHIMVGSMIQIVLAQKTRIVLRSEWGDVAGLQKAIKGRQFRPQ